LLLRIAIPAIFGGCLIVLSPGLGMFWEGLAIIAVGFLTLALWYWGIGSRRPRGARKAAGPTFSPDDPEVAALPPTSFTQIREQVSRARERQRRAQE
jgi:hypothetical protein